MTIARSVLGDIPTNALGVTYMHEHLIIDSRIVENEFKHIWLPSTEAAASEASLCYEVGVRTIVDCMPMGSGGDIRKLVEVSKNSEINIIASTGMHTRKYYESDDAILQMNADELSEKFIEDIQIGSQNTSHKAGIIKVASMDEKLSTKEKDLFEAAAIAHNQTGAPILTHCEHGEGAIEQIELFHKLGISLDNVTISHTDKVDDYGYHYEILSSGVFVEFDQSLRQFEDLTPKSASLTCALLEAGFSDQIMFGTDGARRTLWSTLNGTPGLAWLYSGWSKVLINLGVTQKDLDKFFIGNPSKALQFKEIKNVF